MFHQLSSNRGSLPSITSQPIGNNRSQFYSFFSFLLQVKLQNTMQDDSQNEDFDSTTFPLTGAVSAFHHLSSKQSSLSVIPLVLQQEQSPRSSTCPPTSAVSEFHHLSSNKSSFSVSPPVLRPKQSQRSTSCPPTGAISVFYPLSSGQSSLSVPRPARRRTRRALQCLVSTERRGPGVVTSED